MGMIIVVALLLRFNPGDRLFLHMWLRSDLWWRSRLLSKEFPETSHLHLEREDSRLRLSLGVLNPVMAAFG